MSYIYLVTNKLNGKQYVGQHRYDGDGLDPKYMGSGVALWQAYDKYGIENFDMELLEECDDEDLNPLEQLYIEHYNTFSPNGYNLTTGGDTFQLSEETKTKLSDALKNNESLSKQIGQYSSDGKFIQSFQSSKEAERQLNITASHINECCNGGRKMAGGFIWCFYENDNDLTDLSQYKYKSQINNKSKSKQVNQYDDNGYLVKTYPSIAEAARQIGRSSCAILQVIKGHNPKSNGFRFRYADECGERIEPFVGTKKSGLLAASVN